MGRLSNKPKQNLENKINEAEEFKGETLKIKGIKVKITYVKKRESYYARFRDPRKADKKDDRTGKYGKTREEAIEEITKEIDVLLEEVKDEDERTIVDILTEYNNNRFHVYNRIKESTYVRNQDTIKLIGSYRLGRIKVKDVKRHHTEDFFKQIQNYSQSVIDKTRIQLKRGFDLAVEDDIITSNPLRSMYSDLPKSKKETRDVKAFTIAEQAKFIQNLENYKVKDGANNFKNVFLLSLYTGCRAGEALALTVDDVDFKNNLLHINKTITRNINNQAVVGENGKTKNATRDFPLTDKAIEVLKDAIKNYQPNKKKLLFCDIKTKKPIATQAVNLAFTKYCEENNLPHYGQHMLRHTFVTRCAEGRIPAEVVCKWVGHSKISTTLQIYHTVCPDFENDMCNELDKLQSIF